MSQRILLLTFLIALFSFTALAQSAQQSTPSDTTSADKPAPNSKSIFGSSALEEMVVRRTIKMAEKEHLENLERAREVARISAQLKDVFGSTRFLNSADRKKLEKVEKLTRRIRSGAGGSDSEVTLEQVPRDLESAFARLVDLSEQMRKEVEKTPRQVVSASVIDRANQVLEVIYYARKLSQ